MDIPYTAMTGITQDLLEAADASAYIYDANGVQSFRNYI